MDFQGEIYWIFCFQTQVRENLVLSVWPNCKKLLTIDPTCLAASVWRMFIVFVYLFIWMYSYGFEHKDIRIQLSMPIGNYHWSLVIYFFLFLNTISHLQYSIGTYPTLHDVINKKHYVGFDAIYQYSRQSDVNILYWVMKAKWIHVCVV